ncbi:uncharacterized protein METZ01_LOCUS241823, partial [marine metagenome]
VKGLVSSTVNNLRFPVAGVASYPPVALFVPEYKVKFEVFEGPMDLLLYLVKKEEVDIYEVNL